MSYLDRLSSYEHVDYENIRESIQTFDILLFSGKGFFSQIIRSGTNSPWSHAAMAVRLKEYNWLMCLESTTLSKHKDVITGKIVSGFQMVPLRERMAGYDGIVGWRAINGPRRPEQMERLSEIIREFAGRPYESSKWNLAASALDLTGLFTAVDDLSTIFCTEITRYIGEEVDVVKNTGEPVSETVPGDYDCRNKNVCNVPLKRPYIWAKNTKVISKC